MKVGCYIFVLLSALSSSLHAEEVDMIYGIALGEKIGVAPKFPAVESLRFPILKFRIPVDRNSPVAYFYDVEVDADVETKKIVSVVGRRALFPEQSCIEIRTKIYNHLKEKWPNSVVRDKNEVWHFISKDESRKVRIDCTVGEDHPYETIEVEAVDFKQKKILGKKLKKYIESNR